MEYRWWWWKSSSRFVLRVQQTSIVHTGIGSTHTGKTILVSIYIQGNVLSVEGYVLYHKII